MSIRTSSVEKIPTRTFTTPKWVLRKRLKAHAPFLSQRAHRATLLIQSAAIVLLIGAVLSGCKDTATDPHPPADTTARIVRPGAGSIIHRRWVDLTDAGAEIPGTEVLDTVTVISASASKFGRDSVVLFSKYVTFFSDALHYETNGDVSYISTYRLTGPGFNPYVPEAWVALPCGSRTSGVTSGACTLLVDTDRGTLTRRAIVRH